MSWMSVSIRNKLFCLLLILCVPSGVAIGLLGLHGVTTMGEQLTGRTYSLLTNYDRAFLREKITDVGTMTRQQLQLAEQALYRQATAVEAVLANDEPPASPLCLAEDYDHGRLETETLERYRQYGEQAQWDPQLVREFIGMVREDRHHARYGDHPDRID